MNGLDWARMYVTVMPDWERTALGVGVPVRFRQVSVVVVEEIAYMRSKQRACLQRYRGARWSRF